MKRSVIAIAATLAAFAPAAALADHRPGHDAPSGGGGGTATAISALTARPNPVVFGSATTLSGRLTGANSSGRTIVLEADDTRPYGDRYTRVQGVTATTDNAGRFSFTVRPARNTQYRAVVQGGPGQLQSAGRLVLVRTRVGLVVSDRTPNRGQRIRFSGTVRPPKDGRVILLQRRSSTGRFVTKHRTRLRDAGDEFSRYSRRFRVYRDGVWRVKVPGDLEHVNGFSRRVFIDVG